MKKQVNVAIPKWLYKKIRDYFQANKEHLQEWGVKSVNGLISKWLERASWQDFLLTDKYQVELTEETIEALADKIATKLSEH